MLLSVKSKVKTLFPALKHRNFRLFFVGQTVSLIGTFLQNTAEQWLVYAIMTHSKLALGILSAAQTLPVTFLSLIAGAIADQKSKKTILIYAQTLMTILAFAGAFLVFTHKIQFWQVVVLGLLLGVANAFDWPTRQAFWPEIISDRRDLVSAISLNSAMFNSARAIGPAIAALAIGIIGIAGCYFFNGLSFLAVLLALFLIKTNNLKKPMVKAPLLNNIRFGFSYLKQHREPWLLILLMSIITVFVWSAGTLLPVFAKDILKGNEKTFGFLGVALGIGATIGSLLISVLAERINKVKLLFFSGTSLIFSMLIFAFSQNLILSSIFLSLSGFFFAFFNALDNSLIQMIIPDEIRGRIMSIYVLMFGGTAPFGSIYVTFLANYLGAPLSIAIGLILALIFFLIIFYRFKLGERLEKLLATAK